MGRVLLSTYVLHGMKEKIKVRIQLVTDRPEKCAMIYRKVNEPGYATRTEVLAANGKWRMKNECDVIFDDEKFAVEEV